jgi:hypothetical protein
MDWSAVLCYGLVNCALVNLLYCPMTWSAFLCFGLVCSSALLIWSAVLSYGLNCCVVQWFSVTLVFCAALSPQACMICFAAPWFGLLCCAIVLSALLIYGLVCCAVLCIFILLCFSMVSSAVLSYGLI